MSQQLIGNEENMAKVRELMEKSKQINLGSQMTGQVHIDYTSQYGTHYEGIVVFKRPSMQDYMKMGALKAQYLGAYGVVDARLVDTTIKFMAQVMSTLKVVIVKAPEWLIGKSGKIDVESVVEPDLLYHLYEKYEEWEDSFRKPVQDELQGDSETSAGA